MATIIISSGGTFTPNDGDIYILENSAQGTVTFLGDAQFDVQLNDAGPYGQGYFGNSAVVLSFEDDTSPTVTVGDGVNAGAVRFNGNGDSLDVNVGTGSTTGVIAGDGANSAGDGLNADGGGLTVSFADGSNVTNSIFGPTGLAPDGGADANYTFGNNVSFTSAAQVTGSVGGSTDITVGDNASFGAGSGLYAPGGELNGDTQTITVGDNMTGGGVTVAGSNGEKTMIIGDNADIGGVSFGSYGSNANPQFTADTGGTLIAGDNFNTVGWIYGAQTESTIIIGDGWNTQISLAGQNDNPALKADSVDTVRLGSPELFFDNSTGAVFGSGNDLISVMPPEDNLVERGKWIGDAIASGWKENDDGSWSPTVRDGYSPNDYSTYIYDTSYSGWAGAPAPLEEDPDGVVDGENDGEFMVGGYDDANGDIDSGGDIIDGADGINDVILGNGGNDTIFAGLGDDEVYGGSGNDVIEGGEGNDTLTGDFASDVTDKVVDNSTVEGDDLLIGGAGDDIIYGDSGNSLSAGGPGVPGTTLGDGPGSTGGTFGDHSGGQTVYNGQHSFTTDAFYLGNDIPVLSDANDDVIDGVTYGLGGVDQNGNPTDREIQLQEISFTGAQRGFYGHEVVERSDLWGATDQISSDGTNFQDIVSVNTGDVKITMNDGTVFNTIEVTFAQDADGNTFMFPRDGEHPDAFNSFLNLLNTNNSGIADFEILHIGGTQNGIFVMDGNWADGQFYEAEEGDGGDDTIVGGAGADTMFGEGGDDTFLVGSAADGAGDRISGGYGPDENTDNDTLDLRGAGPVTINATTDGNDAGAQTGTVTFADGSTLKFEGIETILQDEAPDTNDDTATTDEDTAVTISPLENDTDPNGQTLTISTATPPTSPNGTVEIAPNGKDIIFTPDDDFNGPTTITYYATDPDGNETPGTINVSVDPVNDAPDAVNDDTTTPEESALTFNPLGNDTDVDGDDLRITQASVPAAQGVVTFTDTEITFVPAENFTGPATISYSVTDDNGGTDVAEINVDVTNVNDAPEAVDDIVTTPEDTSITFNPTANDEDVDGDDLSIKPGSLTVDPTKGTIQDNGDGTVTFTPAPNYNGPVEIGYVVEDGNGGEAPGTATVNVSSLVDNPDAVDDDIITDEDTPVTIDVLNNDTNPIQGGLSITAATVTGGQGEVSIVNDELVFTPAPDFNGEATITYSIQNADGGTDTAEVTVTVDPVNDAPETVNDIANTDEDTPVLIDLTGNDTDPDGDTPLIGSVSLADPSQGTIVDQGDGTALFTPAPNFNGPVTVNYTADDGNGGVTPGQATINVGPVNDAPDAVDDDGITMAEDGSVLIDVLTNDSDPDGDDISIISVSVTSGQGEAVIEGNQVRFTPSPDYNGPVELSYTISDGNGLTDTATVDLTVSPGDDAPVTQDDTATTDEDTPVTISPLGNDTDPDGQTLTISTATPPTSPNGTVEIAPNGKDIIFTPDDDFNGPTTITYYATDPDGNETPGTITVSVDPVNDAPNAVDDTADAEADTMVVIDVLANDTDPEDDDLRIISATVPAAQGVVVIVGDKLQFTPADNFVGPAEITYTISDDEGAEASATVTVDVAPENPDGVVDGEETGEVMGVGYDDADGPTDGGGDLITDGDDVIDGKGGDDIIDGGDGDDEIFGGSGNDVLEGGEGADVLDGGLNDDDLILGGGDEGRGGAGDDVFTIDDTLSDTGPITVVGGETDEEDVIDPTNNPGGRIGDVLDLRGLDNVKVAYTNGDPTSESGTATYDNENGDTITINFSEIETVIPCFTPGTVIATEQGERLVQDLQPGDRVITRDNGIQEIAWVGKKNVSGQDFLADPRLKPILVKKGSLGNDLPKQDMLLSPNHRLLAASMQSHVLFDEPEVLIAAKHMVGKNGVHQVDVANTTYIHFMFERHEVVLSDGAWTESFHPGNYSLNGIESDQRDEILTLFPELATQDGLNDYQTARMCLKKHEAKLLMG